MSQNNPLIGLGHLVQIAFYVYRTTPERSDSGKAHRSVPNVSGYKLLRHHESSKYLICYLGTYPDHSDCEASELSLRYADDPSAYTRPLP